MGWSDVLKLALSIFLVITGIGLGYLFFRLAGVFARVGRAVTAVSDEVVPILTRAQGTVDGINLELQRVDEMMVTAVNATKGAERTVQTVSSAITTPVRKLTGMAAGVREGIATLKARRAQERADREAAMAEQAAAQAADAARWAAQAAQGAEQAAQQAGAPSDGAATADGTPSAPADGPAEDVHEGDTGSLKVPRHPSPY
ncbi:MAG TPA: hypothetical protein PKE32_02200 [Miltoncostaeaceae bacterium]|nr:hypothetical protein [Miltoncostaeaceae bacterium]